MSGVIDQIKDRIDIVDLISSYLKLQKSGSNYKARCPFHNEKSGSFFVSPERQIWHCFGCGLGGDVFGFVKQIDGVEFPEALRTLAARAGIKLERQSPGYEQFQSAKIRLYEVCELAMKFFGKQLHESLVGKQALAYLLDRGLTDNSINEFCLGYAPDSWSSLYDFLQRNYSDQEILDAGLAVKKDSGGYFDRFRSRIMFPIFDLNGQVVGFTGRVFGELAKQEDVGKYVNSPQTAIYDKSRILYGLDRAKLEIRRANRCLVVEGNMDVIMSHQSCVKNVVASSGTALTDGHLKIVKRYTDNLDLCFDADSAGSMATDRGVELALAKSFNVGIVSLDDPNLKDPADYVKVNGIKWAEVSQNSQPFMEFYFNTARKAFDTTTALGKKLFAQKLLPFLASVANKIEQSHWVSEMSLVLKTKDELLYAELAAIQPKVFETTDATPVTANVGNRPESRLDMQEETLLSLVVKKPDLSQKMIEQGGEYLTSEFKNLLAKLNAVNLPVSGETAVARLASASSADEPALAMSLEFTYLKSQELWKDFEDAGLEEESQKIVSQIKRRKVSAQLAALEYDIRAAEKTQDKKRLGELMSEFSKISKELQP